MKRTVILGVIALAAATSGFAQIDPTIARIRLTRVEVITQKQFRQRIERLEEQLRRPLTGEQRTQILDALVDERVLLQAAERSRVRISDAEFARALDAYKQDFARQLGRSKALSDVELRELLEQQNTTLERFTEQIKDRLTVDKLIAQEQKPLVDSVKVPTEDEIRDFYESNRTKYPIVSPEMVRFKQILLVTTGLAAADLERARAKTEEIYRALQSGAPFDQHQEVFLDGPQGSKIGGLSFETWRRDDETKKVTYGRDFFDTLFSLDGGRRSGIVRSNVGFHIVEVIQKIPFAVLGLDEKIPPQDARTVREYISGLLLQRKRAEAVQRATEDLVKKLRQEADIKVEYEALAW